MNSAASDLPHPRLRADGRWATSDQAVSAQRPPGRSAGLHAPARGRRRIPPRLTRLLVASTPVPLWLLLTYVLFAPLVHDLRGPLPGGADSVLYSWYFREIQVSLWHGNNPFFSTAMNAPTGLNVMWNTALILPAFLMAPVTATLGATTSVAVLMVAAPLAAASVAYWVLYRMSGNLAGGAVGGTLYGFGPFYAGQQGHVHLTVGAIFLPLVLYYGYRLFTGDGQWRRLGWRLGAVVGITMLISEEIVAIAAVVAALSILLLAIKYRDERRSRVPEIAKFAGWAAAIALCICGPALAYQFLGPLTMTEGIHSSLALDLVSVVRPGWSMYFATPVDIVSNHQFKTDGAENTGYLGPVLIAAAILSALLLWRMNRRRLVYWLSSTTGIAFALSLGTSVRVNGHQTYVPMPWFFLSRVPVLETLVPARFSVATLLMVATMLAFGLAALPALGKERAGRTVRALGYLVVIAALIFCWPAPGGLGRLHVATPRFFTDSSVDAIRAGSVVVALPQANSPDGAAAVMKWQIDADMRFSIVGGYSYFSRDGIPHYDGERPAYATLLQRIGETGVRPAAGEAAQARQDVATSVGDYVVVTDQVTHAAAVLAALPEVTGCTPRRVSDVYLCAIVR